jgi:NAD(P)-dependent dehydrogenase (short-subunit alcohol dehydrogenase family)
LREFGAEVCPAVADVRDLDALNAAFATVREQFGPLDCVIAGAAGNFLAPAEKSPATDSERL